MKQVFLDTNVIIDYLGNRTGFYDDAAIIMSLAINQKIKLYAAAISFATASYILSLKSATIIQYTIKGRFMSR